MNRVPSKRQAGESSPDSGTPSVRCRLRAFVGVPSLCALVVVVSSSNAWTLRCAALQAYQANIPNGAKVVRNGVAWASVGHNVPLVTSPANASRNVFGGAFAAENHVWTAKLCQADSDGDGYTNGQELGDPACVWKAGDTPSRTTTISHPGFADSIPVAAVPTTTLAPGVSAPPNSCRNQSWPSGTSQCSTTQICCSLYDTWRRDYDSSWTKPDSQLPAVPSNVGNSSKWCCPAVYYCGTKVERTCNTANPVAVGVTDTPAGADPDLITVVVVAVAVAIIAVVIVTVCVIRLKRKQKEQRREELTREAQRLEMQERNKGRRVRYEIDEESGQIRIIIDEAPGANNGGARGNGAGAAEDPADGATPPVAPHLGDDAVADWDELPPPPRNPSATAVVPPSALRGSGGNGARVGNVTGGAPAGAAKTATIVTPPAPGTSAVASPGKIQPTSGTTAAGPGSRTAAAGVINFDTEFGAALEAQEEHQQGRRQPPAKTFTAAALPPSQDSDRRASRSPQAGDSSPESLTPRQAATGVESAQMGANGRPPAAPAGNSLSPNKPSQSHYQAPTPAAANTTTASSDTMTVDATTGQIAAPTRAGGPPGKSSSSTSSGLPYQRSSTDSVPATPGGGAAAFGADIAASDPLEPIASPMTAGAPATETRPVEKPPVARSSASSHQQQQHRDPFVSAPAVVPLSTVGPGAMGDTPAVGSPTDAAAASGGGVGSSLSKSSGGPPLAGGGPNGHSQSGLVGHPASGAGSSRVLTEASPTIPGVSRPTTSIAEDADNWTLSTTSAPNDDNNTPQHKRQPSSGGQPTPGGRGGAGTATQSAAAGGGAVGASGGASEPHHEEDEWTA